MKYARSDSLLVHFVCQALALVGFAVLVLVIVAPCAALLSRTILDGRGPTDGWWISSRQWGLLGTTLLLAGCATALSLLAAWPVAAVLASAGSEAPRAFKATEGAGGSDASGSIGLVRVGMIAALLVSPMVACFGWQHLLRMTTPPLWVARVGCVFVWAMWIWPVPAMMLSAAWRRTGRSAYEAALTCCGAARAFVWVGLPSIRASLAASALTVMTLLMAEYLVPHAWGLKVYATELLSWATATDRALDAVYPAAPLCLCMTAVAVVMWRLVKAATVRERTSTVLTNASLHDGGSLSHGRGIRTPHASEGLDSASEHNTRAPLPCGRGSEGWWLRQTLEWDEEDEGCGSGSDRADSNRAGLVTRLLAALVALGSCLPVAGLAWRLASVDTLLEVLRVHRDDLLGSLGVCLAAGLASVVLAAGASAGNVTASRGSALARFGWGTVLFGVLPGAVVGSAVAAAYGPFALTADHWIKLVAGLTARFAWVAWVAAVVSLRGSRAIEEQAAMDGAGPARILLSMRLARGWPMLSAAGLAVAALALSDLATTVQVQVSSFMPISLVLVDKMHKFEDAYVVAISLCLAVCALPAIVAVALARRRV